MIHCGPEDKLFFNKLFRCNSVLAGNLNDIDSFCQVAYINLIIAILPVNH